MSLTSIRPHKDEILKLLAPPSNKTQREIIKYLTIHYGIKTSKSAISRLKKEAIESAYSDKPSQEADRQNNLPVLNEIRNRFQDIEMRFELLTKQIDVECSKIRSALSNTEAAAASEPIGIRRFFNRKLTIALLLLCLTAFPVLSYVVSTFRI